MKNAETFERAENQEPGVSIGLPVYNGQNFLSAAIDSILGQTYQNWELIITDNGSTDETAQICQRYAERDSRIKVFRSEENRGASWNYNRSFELARAPYFRWLAHDDCLAPELIEKSVAELDNNAGVVLAFTWTQDIDENGNLLDVKQSTVNSTDPRPNVRFRGLSDVRASHNCEEVFGLVRAAILRRTNKIGNYTDSDRTLLAELGLYGPFCEIPEPLFLHRVHAESSVVVTPDPLARAAWFDPTKKGKASLPKWRQLYELFRVVTRSPISLSEKLRCYGHMFRWAKRRRRRLTREIMVAYQQKRFA